MKINAGKDGPDNGLPRSVRRSTRGKTLRFGDLITAVYDACGTPRARGILRAAVNTHVVAFRGPNHYQVS